MIALPVLTSLIKQLMPDQSDNLLIKEKTQSKNHHIKVTGEVTFGDCANLEREGKICTEKFIVLVVKKKAKKQIKNFHMQYV